MVYMRPLPASNNPLELSFSARRFSSQIPARLYVAETAMSSLGPLRKPHILLSLY
jgi:hypothetical protein